MEEEHIHQESLPSCDPEQSRHDARHHRRHCPSAVTSMLEGVARPSSGRIREVQDGEVVFEAGDRGKLFVLESRHDGALPFLFASCFSFHHWRYCTTLDCPAGHETSTTEL